jgi:hypothetical protein
MCKLKDQIRKATAREPLLTDHGLGIYNHGYGLSKSEIREEFQKEREALFTNVNEFGKICRLLKRVNKIKTINTGHGSYALKHAAERTVGCYVSNGIFIAAAIHCGFDYKKNYDEVGNLRPNVVFNMSERSIKKVFIFDKNGWE